MSTPGWYPDPGGEPDRYRFWDGVNWSDSTSSDPRTGPPTSGPRAAGASSGRLRRRAGWGIAVLALVVVVAVVIGLVVDRSGTRILAGDGPVPRSSGSGGNDTTPRSAPTPSARSSPSSPSPAPSRTPGLRPSRDPCPSGDPLARQDHSSDGRIHGGGLSMPAQRGWQTPGVQVSGFSWAYDVGETDVYVQPTWLAAYAVGAVSVADGFDSPRTAARLAMACTASSSFYRDLDSRRDLSSHPTRVGGRPGWTLRSEIRMSGSKPYAGDVVQITVVDLGSPESLAVFWGCAPIGEQPLIRRLNRVAAGLRVD